MDLEIDRLSSLPDDLIHKILSFVGIIYSIRLSVLSSRWRFIWTSMPNLNYSGLEVYRSSPCHEFVNNVLSGRNNKIDVSSVSLKFASGDTESAVKKILEYALSHNVQQLMINGLSYISDCEFHLSPFSSKSLKHLTITSTTIDGLSSWDLPALTTLHLHDVILDNCSSILTLCQNLKNLTLEGCQVFERESSKSFTDNSCTAGEWKVCEIPIEEWNVCEIPIEEWEVCEGPNSKSFTNNSSTLDGCEVCEHDSSKSFTINSSRLLNLTLTEVAWHVDFVHVNTPQLKNLIFVDKPPRYMQDYYGSRISGSPVELTISARDLTYLLLKGSYLFVKLSVDGSLEKVDLRISSPPKTDVYKICDLFHCLHSVKSLALSLEIFELLSSSVEVISHQRSPFASLKSLKIYPTQLDHKDATMNVKLSTEVKNYLLDGSPNATVTMVSREEARVMENTYEARRLMADLRKYLQKIENRSDVERKMTLLDDWRRNFNKIFYPLSEIKKLLTNVLASKRVEMQACFFKLCADAETTVNKILDDMKNELDMNRSIFGGIIHSTQSLNLLVDQSSALVGATCDRGEGKLSPLAMPYLTIASGLHVFQISAFASRSRWRFIWTSMPDLNFESRELSRSSPYHEFVNNVLSGRNNKIDVSSVSLNLSVEVEDTESVVKRILEYAFSHNMLEKLVAFAATWTRFVLTLIISIASSKAERSCVPLIQEINFKSLKHLTMIGTTISGLSYSPWDLPALTTLHLSVRLDNCSSILAMCQNLKNLTLERCEVFERKSCNGFSIINSRLLNLTLKKVEWYVDFVLVDTPQLKNLIFVDPTQREDSYSFKKRSIRDILGGLTISARELTYLRIKGSYFPKLSLDGSLEKVDLCISSPLKTDVHKICDLFQHLHSVKSLALSLEIVELLSNSEEVISHQPSPFASLKSLKIYPLKGLKTFPLQCLRMYPLKSSLEMFPNQLDQEQEAMKTKLSAEVTNYLLDSSSNTTFTMVSHEGARAIKITKEAHRLMADLWTNLEEMEAYTETKRANVEWKKTLADSCGEDFKMKIWPLGDTEVIFCILQNIKLLLTKVLASKRVELQACFSRLSEKAKTIVNKMVVDMKNQCDIKQRIFSGYFDEIALSS
ncbi:F-box domain, Leucine-rich repeat domain, L domain-like protein [Artemisia annua]|uniref:F-box domain, Leucine-rich repeat domain, L domain-like protein n=1 Tax=Artemisia annua TaxID=35608 RepID=A0A2U1LDZ0_ARTAN|nr:F-box domain, Leucine-rich repeat domain, L domain-like protein [Artemisia annua]